MIRAFGIDNEEDHGEGDDDDDGDHDVNDTDLVTVGTDTMAAVFVMSALM